MELNMRDPTTIAVVGAILAATLLFFCYAMVDNCRQSKRTHRWLALHQPLHPSAIDLRLDAALRDAQDGFSVCDACQFENLKRNIFCTLCGAPVTDPATAGSATGSDKKKNKALVGKRKDKLLWRQQLASASSNHRRRARALKRKEWARRLDAQGQLVWVHHPSAAPERGFVLHFHGDPLVPTEDAKDEAADQDGDESSTKEGTEQQPEAEPVGEAHVAITINDAAESETSANASTLDAAATQNGAGSQDSESQERTPKPKLELLPLDATSERLEAEIATHPMQLADAATADPGRPAIVLHAVPQFGEEPKVLIATAQLNFPAKLAEFVTRASTVMMLSEQSFLKFKIRRDTLLADSLLALAATPARCARCPVRMSFVGEQGIDAGGVYREWLVLVNEQIVVASAGIFRCVDSRDQSFYLNPTSLHDIGDHHLAHFFAAGRLLGRMLLEGNVTGFHLALPLLKIIVGQPVTFSDLEYFDPEAFKSLSWLLENEGVEQLGLDFTATEQTAIGETLVVELVPGGAQMDVTDSNKREYVDLKFKYLLFGSVQHQLFAFLKGLYEVMPPELLMMFDAEELDFVLSGSDEIDVDDWERNAKYTEDLVEHPVRGWFWEILRDMPNEYRRRLLLFSTGSSRVPLAGFAALTSYDGRLCPFTLKGVDMAECGEYIHSHACFNRLDLPRYAKKKDLKAVLYGILDTDLYGFTTA